MRSFLIISAGKDAAAEQITAICDRFSINYFDRMVVGRTEEGKEKSKVKKSIGIEDVKKMQKKIFLKPLKGKMKAVIIPEAEILTVEAQNALLKVLEEPPENTLMILVTRTLDPILPTIQSRCYIMPIDTISLATETSGEAQTLVASLLTLDEKEAIALAEQLEKKKEKLPEQLEAVVHILHEQLITAEDVANIQRIAAVIRAMQHAYTLIKTTNANQRLTLEAVLLSLTQKADQRGLQQ